ncbi:MAG: ferritin-like domain-containing protein [Candidatus Zixiibacteriota bacterium]
MIDIKDKKKVVAALNRALGWELRAYAMYAHYAAYVKGLESLTLKGHFEEEASESIGHAAKVRDIIALLGGVAATERDPKEIVHTEDHVEMLKEALKTETVAAQTYEKIIPLIKAHPVYMHTLMHIYMEEISAVEEAKNLLGQ